MAGKSIYAKMGVAPGNAKALSHVVAAHAGQSGMMLRANLAASFLKPHVPHAAQPSAQPGAAAGGAKQPTGTHAPASAPAQPAAEAPKPAKAPKEPKPPKEKVDRHVGVTIRGPDAGVPTEVRVLGRSGALLMHTSRDGKGFGVTHGPSQRLVAEVETKAQARRLMKGMSKGKTFERALAGDKRAIDAGDKYIAKIKASGPKPKPEKGPKEAKVPKAPRAPKGAKERATSPSDKALSGHTKVDFGAVLSPIQAAARALPGILEHGAGTARTLAGV